MKVCGKCETPNGPSARTCKKCEAPFPPPGTRSAKKAGKKLPVVRPPKVEPLSFLASLAGGEDGPCLVLMRGGAFTRLSADETEQVALTLGLVFFQDAAK